MSYTPCPMCGGMLEGDAESPCVNKTCVNSPRGRAVRDDNEIPIGVDLAAVLSETPGKPPKPKGPNRKARRKAARARRSKGKGRTR